MKSKEYNKDRLTHDITQDGDAFTIVSGGMGPVKTSSFIVGAGSGSGVVWITSRVEGLRVAPRGSPRDAGATVH